MNAPCLAEHLQPRAQEQMVGVCQDDGCLGMVAQGVVQDGLDTAECAHWHENGSAHKTMRGVEESASGIRAGVFC